MIYRIFTQCTVRIDATFLIALWLFDRFQTNKCGDCWKGGSHSAKQHTIGQHQHNKPAWSEKWNSSPTYSPAAQCNFVMLVCDFLSLGMTNKIRGLKAGARLGHLSTIHPPVKIWCWFWSTAGQKRLSAKKIWCVIGYLNNLHGNNRTFVSKARWPSLSNYV